MNPRLLVAVLILALLLVATSILIWSPGGERGGGGEMQFSLKSVFENNGTIPRRYTCDGEDLSPPLSWQGGPKGAVSYVLIVDDPDAPVGVFTHWILYNIPASLNSLPEGVPKGKETSYGLQGRNDFGDYGYGGPCPPRGKPHRYFFKLYALDTMLELAPGARKSDVEKAMRGHVIGEAQLVGLYGRG
ncbi:MAG: YbhB/YbcL family Raf kinase inhibitor-like protein [Candidatus Korarchaeum sp.]